MQEIPLSRDKTQRMIQQTFLDGLLKIFVDSLEGHKRVHVAKWGKAGFEKRRKAVLRLKTAIAGPAAVIRIEDGAQERDIQLRAIAYCLEGTVEVFSDPQMASNQQARRAIGDLVQRCSPLANRKKS